MNFKRSLTVGLVLLFGTYGGILASRAGADEAAPALDVKEEVVKSHETKATDAKATEAKAAETGAAASTANSTDTTSTTNTTPASTPASAVTPGIAGELRTAVSPKKAVEVFKLDGHISWSKGVAISADGSRALSGSDDDSVRLWDLQSGKELKRFDGHEDDVTSVAFSPSTSQS